MEHSEWIELIYKRRQLTPVQPAREGVARLHHVPHIKAVVFDIYGTLFSSGVGDISLASEQDRDDVIKETLEDSGYRISPEGRNTRIDDVLHAHISSHQSQRRAEGVAYPEVEIRAVWQDFLNDCTHKQYIVPNTNTAPLETLIIDYESRINPTQAIPGLLETLKQIRSAGLQLSIISNAQFYTPLLFETYLDKTTDELGFDPECSVWSYIELEGKPSKRLYELSAARLKTAHGIEPREVLYVGNDLRNDIWPAQLIGFNTALFSGDELSLRLRKDDPDCCSVKADIEITELKQLFECLGFPPQ